jgi:hypothetical protein
MSHYLRTRILIALGLPASAVACTKEQPPVVAKPDNPEPPVVASTAPPVVASTAPPTEDAAALEDIGIVVDPPGTGHYGCGSRIDCEPEGKTAPKTAAAAPYGKCAATRTAKANSGTLDGIFDATATKLAREKRPNDCCFKHKETVCSGGRILATTEGPLLSQPMLRADWLDPALKDLELPHDEARASRWLREAAFEHASVASFARVALELMALGAPPDLIADTHSAALDEIAHARTCYAVARAHGGATLGPSTLSLETAAPLAHTHASLAIATYRDACVPETIAALELRERAREEPNVHVRAAMLRIADDEDRHVELAFRTLAWAVNAGGESARRALELELIEDARAGVRDVALPCAQALLRAASRSHLPRFT